MGYPEETKKRVEALRASLEKESEKGLILSGTSFLEDELKMLVITYLEFVRDPQGQGGGQEGSKLFAGFDRLPGDDALRELIRELEPLTGPLSFKAMVYAEDEEGDESLHAKI